MSGEVMVKEPYEKTVRVDGIILLRFQSVQKWQRSGIDIMNLGMMYGSS